ncbi:hypothetical protein yc1106_02812 [Curvularia clavata]|uniref:Uncharacterized protein n=1 Tax=Curvularia clavata TaxID=95742 RepID=A0A9Q8Z758_CURCL|nr:hypothetical protein yc1106_02812 [Curvularia clavata]
MSLMNTFQRDSFKKVIPGFKSDTFNLKHDRNLHTLHLSPGKYIIDMSGGFTVPTLDDITRGLRHLASGLDARCMTECLDWYLSWRNAFTPPLQLNVLQVQALSRALRVPLRPFGPQNLDLNALAEWKEKGRFEERPVARRALIQSTVNRLRTDGDIEEKKNQISINLSTEKVKLHFQFPIRHVLTFPFLALHGVVGEGLKLGIAKAEKRRMERRSGGAAE